MTSPTFAFIAPGDDAPDAPPPEAPPVTLAPVASTDTLAEGEAKVETITAADAQEALRHNTRNRKVNWTVVRDYARDMKAGRWIVNGETMKIATDRQIIDGQKRYIALIVANCPGVTISKPEDALAAKPTLDITIRSYVARGLPPETQDTVDIGEKRKLAQQLAMHREANPQNLAIITRWAWRWVRGARQDGGSTLTPTHAEQLAFIDAEPRLRQAAQYATEAGADFRSIRPGVWGMAWLIFMGINDVAAELFLTQVRTGALLNIGDPAHTLRARMIKAKGPYGERLTAHEELHLVIMAWNSFREGKPIAKLPLPPHGLTSKNFVVPK